MVNKKIIYDVKKIQDKKVLLFLLCLILFYFDTFSQEVTLIRIERAGVLTSGNVNGKQVRILKNDVLFSQEDVLMYCDSAYQFEKDNNVTAYGNVHISQHDTLHLYGNLLEYNGSKRYAVLNRNVRMQDKKMTLTTDRLEYDMRTRNAHYNTGAIITEGDNILTSKKGHYNSATKTFYFRKNVVVTTPDFTIWSDTLSYNKNDSRVYFFGPTTINTKKDTITCQSGWYHTQNGEAHLGSNPVLKSNGQQIKSDSLEYFRYKDFGIARGNVIITDTAEKLNAKGAYAEYDKKNRTTFITGNPLVIKEYKNDTINITGDTIRSREDTLPNSRLLRAYRNVKIYSRQFQAMCDSLTFSFKDSVMQMEKKPVFWFGEYQATAEKILIYTEKNKIKKADMFKKSFLLTPEDSLRFSQVKGRDMTASFYENELSKIDVKGNAESIYYAKDDKKKYIGVNKISSSNMAISVKERKIHKINFIKQPEAVLTPLKDANPADFLFQGFINRMKDRPTSLESIWKPMTLPIDFVPKKTPVKEDKKKKKGKKK